MTQQHDLLPQIFTDWAPPKSYLISERFSNLSSYLRSYSRLFIYVLKRSRVCAPYVVNIPDLQLSVVSEQNSNNA